MFLLPLPVICARISVEIFFKIPSEIRLRVSPGSPLRISQAIYSWNHYFQSFPQKRPMTFLQGIQKLTKGILLGVFPGIFP